ncbi:MAG: hypothetical protein JXR32_04260, partial [Anaerolineaceae bacterium]|nr:hypothetical protein [Anaerolineaceae bacterium]
AHEHTGSKTILLVTRSGRTSLWEPLSERQQDQYTITRSLYKNTSGTALVFEEHNLDLSLIYRYAWRMSERFGFIKTSWLANTGESACQSEALDGLQNILPANVTEQTQKSFSCLLDAYKRSEVDPANGLAIYYLNSRLIDKAEPSESLLATTVAQTGLGQADYLLSSDQLDRFRAGQGIASEMELRGRRGAYFTHATFDLPSRFEQSWHLLADILQDSAAIARLAGWLREDSAACNQELESDIAAGQANLWKMVASADGLQLSNDRLCADHHFANVMFNIMRGGIFGDQYRIKSSEFIGFVTGRDHPLLEAHKSFFSKLPTTIHLSDLQAKAEATGSGDLIRLCYAYLPLTFSRRHGDPSRPWNRFTINIKNSDGSLKLDYQGNWRDIFQNWEALAWSYPEFIESMISTFLNATSVDGYNPYRISHQGIDWEVPEPGNPWANIGYWSDHQIIYLQKLMEISAHVHPGKLQKFLVTPVFSYADVPYRLKPFQDLLGDPHNTIEFDWEKQHNIEDHVHRFGSDARLVRGSDGRVVHGNLVEKLMTLLLAKLTNFVPEGGIWMNTQRPEWNDANNALVGKGLSVVTLCHLRRTLAFCRELFSQSPIKTVSLHMEVHAFYARTMKVLRQFQAVLDGSFNDRQRREMMDALGGAGSDYRWGFYKNGLQGEQIDLPVKELITFLDLMQQYIEHSLRANRRRDNLYHAYNILHLEDSRASISRLDEMLEGQVAVLSSGMLTAEESLALLLALRNSALYQTDRNSYLLYPDRDLPGFMEKNSLKPDQVKGLGLFAALVEAQDQTLITKDIEGMIHFSGHIRNFEDARSILDTLKRQPRYEKLVEAEFEKIKALFEDTFHHNEYTGRSGTFFAYEGLGSIYWHMVSKLLLAAQETALRFKNTAEGPVLSEAYRDIRAGLGFMKTPADYGAFPTDPYSHTPKGRGAKQPGMTGMVKETILARQAELGWRVEGGQLIFDPWLLDPREFLAAPATFFYLDVREKPQQINLQAGSLAFTICETPVVILRGKTSDIRIHYSDGTDMKIDSLILNETDSRHIFQRDGIVTDLKISFPKNVL